MIASALIFTNLAVGLLLIAVNVHCYNVTCMRPRWIHLSYAVVGAFWIVFYILYITNLFSKDALQMVVRPGITVTLAVMVASSILRMRLR